MTPLDFEIAISYTRLKERSQKATYEVLVNGRSIKEVSVEMGVTYNTVYTAVKRVERAFKTANKTPPGWVVLTVSVPPELSNKIQAMSDHALLDYFKAECKGD